MNMNQLVDTYFDQIKIEATDYVRVDYAASNAAYLLLNIPTAMLKEYLRLKCQNGELPDGAEFWKETGLGKRLRNSDKDRGQEHKQLEDVLDYLGGDVWGEYQELNSPGEIWLAITEIPEFYVPKSL